MAIVFLLNLSKVTGAIALLALRKTSTYFFASAVALNIFIVVRMGIDLQLLPLMGGIFNTGIAFGAYSYARKYSDMGILS